MQLDYVIIGLPLSGLRLNLRRDFGPVFLCPRPISFRLLFFLVLLFPVLIFTATPFSTLDAGVKSLTISIIDLGLNISK